MIDADDSYYNDLDMHRTMLRDRVRRCEAFRHALTKSVKSGDVVLDVGAGTGILSLFATRAGARKVYAVECIKIVDFARQSIATNNSAEEQVQIIPTRRKHIGTIRVSAQSRDKT